MENEKQIIARWQSVSGGGREHIELKVGAGGVMAEAVCLSPKDMDMFGVWYQVDCDPAWNTTRVRARLIGGMREIDLRCANGRWTDSDGREMSELNGCTDVDLSMTPFTNTLPIRRLSLAVGATADIMVVYLKLPDLEICADPQRYTRLTFDRYKFESVDTDFVAEIEVDQDGLVTNYPGLFLRIA